MTDKALNGLLKALGAQTGRHLEIIQAEPDRLELTVSPVKASETIILSGHEVFALCDILASGAARIGWEGDYRRLLTTSFYWQCFRPVRARTLKITAVVQSRGSRLINVRLVVDVPEAAGGPCAEANVTIYARPSKPSRQKLEARDEVELTGA